MLTCNLHDFADDEYLPDVTDPDGIEDVMAFVQEAEHAANGTDADPWLLTGMAERAMRAIEREVAW